MTNEKVMRFGCHCDLGRDETPDGCVIDTRWPGDCIYAPALVAAGKSREACQYWREVTIGKSSPAEINDDRKQLVACQKERDELHQICRDAYEVWAGSEGIPEPVNASEAYLYQLLINMRDEVKRGLAKVGTNKTGEE